MNFTIKKFLKTILPLLISYSLDEKPAWRDAERARGTNILFGGGRSKIRLRRFIPQWRSMKLDYTYLKLLEVASFAEHPADAAEDGDESKKQS